MPTSVWLSWKRSLACKSQPGEVHDPQTLADSKVEAVFVTRRLYRSGCSRSIANLKDVIHSSRRIERSTNFSPRSVESSDFIQPISHEAILRVQGCDAKTDEVVGENFKSNGLVYGTHGHQSAVSNSGYSTPLHHSAKGSNTLKKFSGCYDCRNPAVSLVVYKASSTPGSLPPIARPVCQRCGDVFPKYEALEQHHLLRHAVTELEAGDSSRNVVEIIFRTSWLRGGADQAVLQASSLKIERVLKVNNLPKTLARFEEYREGVKARASKLPKKHPRCLADGNELLRFFTSSLMCALPSGVCTSPACNVCQIIRWGFRTSVSGSVSGSGSGSGNGNSSSSGTTSSSSSGGGGSGGSGSGSGGGSTGVLTAASSGHAHHHPHPCFGVPRRCSGDASAMIVCRVVAGRVHKPSTGGGGDCSTAAAAVPLPPPPPGFDSIAGDATAPHTRIEELTVFNPRAILPCFVVIYRC